MQYAKKKEKDLAFTERLKVIEAYYSKAGKLVEQALNNYWRADVARDDIMDALALAVTASIGEDKLTVVSSEPKLDSRGLPMQMVYYLNKEQRSDTGRIP